MKSLDKIYPKVFCRFWSTLLSTHKEDRRKLKFKEDF